jgi:hypothetical protein
VLGLGYEELRALGAREMIDPAKTCLFLADPPLDSRYLDRVKTANELLLEQTPNDEHFGYDPLNPEYTFRLLADVCEGSLKSGAVIIVPLGPKPFALVSLVVARSLEGVEVWRVSGGSYEDAVDRAPSDVFIGCRIPAHLQA